MPISPTKDFISARCGAYAERASFLRAPPRRCFSDAASRACRRHDTPPEPLSRRYFSKQPMHA